MKLFLHNLKYKLQILLHKTGWHISKYTPIKAEDDTYKIQAHLLNDTPVSTVFDVGAWIGKTAISYSQTFPNAKIHVFEPFPESFEKLSANLSNNGDTYILNQLAVSSSCGSSALHSNKIETTNSLLESLDTNSNHDFYRDTVNIIEVKTTTLDDYCRDNGIEWINVLKIDTQGGELEVFKGASHLLENQLIDVIYCEVSFVPMYKNSPLFNDIMSYLLGHGYVFYSLYGEVKNEHGQLAWSDAIFYNKRTDAALKNNT